MERHRPGRGARRFQRGDQALLRAGNADSQQSTLNLLYYTRDRLGSIRELTDASATVRARYDYDPYDRRTKLSGDLEADFAFTGHYYHAPSALHLTLYRAYDAELGRWLSRDPIGEAGGINLYWYVANNPVNASDPLGLWTSGSGNHENFDDDNGSALDDFLDQYNKMREANWKNSDKYFRCMANCEAAKKGHSKGVKQLSEARELFDEHVKGDSKKNCDADREANDHGREAGENGEDCKSACDQYRPAVLPDKY